MLSGFGGSWLPLLNCFKFSLKDSPVIQSICPGSGDLIFHFHGAFQPKIAGVLPLLHFNLFQNIRGENASFDSNGRILHEATSGKRM
jgi:hypothetical protein